MFTSISPMLERFMRPRIDAKPLSSRASYLARHYPRGTIARIWKPTAEAQTRQLREQRMTHDPKASAAPTTADEERRAHHVCPWWVGYLIASPLRRMAEDPDSILAPLAKPGMTVVDAGAAMGFFSLPLARFVGDTGRVVCVDVQPRMLSTLSKRAKRNGVAHIIECRACTQEDLGLGDLEGQADLAVAVHVVHETAYPRRFLSQICEALRPGGKFLVIEPRGHVSESDFEATRGLCREVGFHELESKQLRRSRSLLLKRP